MLRSRLLDTLEESMISNYIDIVHFDTADEDFKSVALAGAKSWKQSSHKS
jgi:hypothetical protein